MTRCLKAVLYISFPNMESAKKFCFLSVRSVILRQNVNSMKNHCFLVGQCIEASLIERSKKLLFSV